jgi:hypothetical protein
LTSVTAPNLRVSGRAKLNQEHAARSFRLKILIPERSVVSQLTLSTLRARQEHRGDQRGGFLDAGWLDRILPHLSIEPAAPRAPESPSTAVHDLAERPPAGMADRR